MKKVLSKLTGLSIVLAMVFNLFMPMMVSAVDNQHFQFNADGGTWREGAKKGTTNDLDINASSTSGQLTEEQAIMLSDSECLSKSGVTLMGWKEKSSFNILNTKEALMKLTSSSAGMELDPVWGKSVNVKVILVVDGTKQSEQDFPLTIAVGGTYNIKEDTAPDAWKAIQPGAKYKVDNYTATGGGLSSEQTFNTLSDLEKHNFGNDAGVTIKVNVTIKKFTITLHSNFDSDVTREVTVNYGDTLANLKLALDVTKPEHKFAGWYKEKECINKCNLDASITANMDIFAKWVKVYNILPGGNNNIDIQKGMDLVVRADGNANNFSQLYVDDKLVDRSNYEVTSGSTIVTLKASYLDTLPPGDHTIKFVYDDGGEAVATFKTVAGDDASVSDTSSGSGSSGGGSSGSPKTGDAGIAMWGILLSASLVGAAASIRCFRKAK